MPPRVPPSIRFGMRPEVAPLGLDEMSKHLRVALWNAVYAYLPDGYLSFIWRQFLRRAADEYGEHGDENCKDVLRSIFMDDQVANVVDLLEFLSVRVFGEDIRSPDDLELAQNFDDDCNAALEEHKSGWRILKNGEMFPGTSEQEVQEISRAFDTVREHPLLAGSQTHLKGALTQFKAGHHSKAAGEAILAMESFARAVTGEKGTLGQLTSKLMTMAGLSKAVGNSIGALYGWSSEEGGMRHGLNVGDEPADEAEARFLLVTVSAYINLLTTKLLKKGVKL